MHSTSFSLPNPDPGEQRHSEHLRRLLCDRITESPLRFGEFMTALLYEPGLGYYVSGLQKFGEHGDFITAPELGSVFGRCVANQCAEILDHLEGGDILEVGAGSGALANQVLRHLQSIDCLPERYCILEISPDLRQLQHSYLMKESPDLFERIQWLDGFPEPEFEGVIIANELLDALAVERFRVVDGQPRLLHIGLGTGQEFQWQVDASQAGFEQKQINYLAPFDLPEGYESEFPLQMRAWIGSLAGFFKRGVVLFFDYGYPAAEFYHPQRHRGTLACHYRHRRHDDPLVLPGLQDITAHVDFSAVADTAIENDLEVLGYTRQSQFLMATGLSELSFEELDDRSQILLAQEVKKLTLPSEMGELFKVIALGRGDLPVLRGFGMNNDMSRL